jgi:hypothetical protein
MKEFVVVPPLPAQIKSLLLIFAGARPALALLVIVVLPPPGVVAHLLTLPAPSWHAVALWLGLCRTGQPIIPAESVDSDQSK